ncbi:MAG: ATP-binding protein [Cyanobacteria bacterium P01_D01_bin.56]
MGLAFYKKLFLDYQNASLPLKISVPFIVMFLIFWAGSTTAVGIVFANQLEHEQRTEAKELIELVKGEIDKELSELGQEASLLALKEKVVQGTILGNSQQLRQSILPVNDILNIHRITVVNREQQKLFHLQDIAWRNSNVQTQEVKQVLTEGENISTFVSATPSGQPMLMGIASIENGQDIVGEVILGTALDNNLLIEINQLIKEQILIVDAAGGIVASTFSPDFDLARLEHINFHDLKPFVNIAYQDYVTQSIEIEGEDSQTFKLVLLVSQESLTQSLRTLWLSIVPMTVLGAVVTTILGYWIAQRIARPILDISLIAQRVAGENRFDLRATANTKDDISILAISLNQLIEWVGHYTYELEVAAQTLESRVDDRTKELSDALHKLKETQAQLIQTEKMSSLGQMVAGIAHEINNPISFIQGNIEPLEDYFQDLLGLIKTYETTYPKPATAIVNKRDEMDFNFVLEDLNKVLNSMNVGTQRVHEIVQSLRNFSRLDEATIKDVDIHEGLDSTLLILNHRLKYDVTVVKEYGDLPLVRCVPAQINQVFTNIISNALDAMLDANSEPKRITISTCEIDNQQIAIIIRDSGPGIPADIQAKIFDPFFTTKPVGKGTGLGLGICFKIIQQHQGAIKVRSKVGKGTEFSITLPTNVLPPEPLFSDLVNNAAAATSQII